MHNIELDSKIVVFIGPPDSGKSNLVKYMLSLPEYKNHLVYDCLFGFDPEVHNVLRPHANAHRYRRYEEGNPQLNQAVDEFVLGPEPENRPDFLAVDEFGRLLPNHKPEGPAIGELNDFNAHYGIGLWLIGQRLAQLNSDLENKATHYFVMGYMGKNDRDALRQIHEDLPEYLDSTSEFGFVHVGPNNAIQRFKPVEKMNAKGKL